MRCRIFLKGIIFLSLCLLSTIPYPALYAETHFLFNHFSAADGLPSNFVRAVYQDRLGFIWIGTTKGLVRYDGYSYKTYNTGENLAENFVNKHVLCLQEDSNANLWFGTAEHGLFYKDGRTGYINRLFHPEDDETCRKAIKHLYVDIHDRVWIIYDDYTVDGFRTDTWQLEHFYHDAEDSCSIASDRLGYARGNFLYVPAFCEDQKHRIWFGTEDSGISRYDPQTGCFTHYKKNPQDSASLSSNAIKCILRDSRNDIWIASVNGGVDRYVPDSDSFQHISLKFSDKESLSTYSCDFMMEDELGRLWLTTYRDSTDGLNVTRNPEEDAALFCFDVEKNTFVRYSYNPNTPDIPFPEYTFPLFSEKNGVVWCYNTPTVLERYDGYSPNVSVVKASPDIPNTFRGYTVTSLIRDHSNMVWIGTWLAGLNKYNPYVQSFMNYRYIPNDSASLQTNRINALHESKNFPGKLYIGLPAGYGLRYLDLEKGVVYSEKLTGDRKYIKNLYNISSICSDRSGTLWVACFADRLFRIQNNYISLVSTNPESGKSFGVPNLWTVAADSSGMIWVGTKPEGVRCFDNQRDEITVYSFNKNDSTSLSDNRVEIIYIDKQNDVWVGTENGLNLFNRDSHNFKRYLAGVSIKYILEDDHERLWLGTLGDGLLLFNRQSKEIVNYESREAIAGNVIYSIVQDYTGNLWIAADGGLTRFNPGTKEVANFYEEHGLPSVKFHSGALLAGDGQIYLGTQEDGIVAFDPNDVKQNMIPPKIVLTDILLFDESLPVRTSPLQEDVSIAKEIELKHWQNDISFEMTALHYAHPEKNTYQYWLENYDEDWHDNGTNRIADYTNLDPGQYIFHAKAANADGFWNEEPTSLRITIHPPWWATGWAYGLYLLLFVGIVVTTWKLQVRRIKLRHDLQKREFESQQLRKVDHLKSQFFANISHEFRTPITLVKGPLEKLAEKTRDKNSQKDLSIMRRNINRLQRLINQLLDLSALESGKLELKPVTQDVVRLVRFYVQSFESQAKLKGISLTFAGDTNELYAFIDKHKMEDIVYNLVSNAIKFTDKGGEVKVHVVMQHQTFEYADKWFEIRVSDTGIGIPEGRVEFIFDRFYQVDDSHTRQHEGSGIGLALTKELVELHGGSITVNSVPGVGSVFTVRLPVGDVDPNAMKHDLPERVAPVEDVITESKNEIGTSGEPLVLIVEDNADLRAYIRDVMGESYRFNEAADGEAGFDLAKKTVPDLIISDVMMPKMDGYQLCGRIKTDELTSHIPVILLTARASKENKLEGLETGADDYLIKPFDPDELLSRVKNLIEQRRKLRERFAKRLIVEPKDISVTSADERFMQRALAVLEEHLSDSQFNAERFAEKVGTSRSSLYLKVHGLTGLSTTEFIRSMRLKRAASLIRKKSGSISEIVYQVGFNHLSYFSKCFKKQFGVTPSEFAIEKRPK